MGLGSERHFAGWAFSRARSCLNAWYLPARCRNGTGGAAALSQAKKVGLVGSAPCLGTTAKLEQCNLLHGISQTHLNSHLQTGKPRCRHQAAGTEQGCGARGALALLCLAACPSPGCSAPGRLICEVFVKCPDERSCLGCTVLAYS